jgi:hypothetical protein
MLPCFLSRNKKGEEEEREEGEVYWTPLRLYKRIGSDLYRATHSPAAKEIRKIKCPKVPFGFTQNQEQECSVKTGGKLNAESWMT